MGADDSREIQLMYIDKLLSNNIMLSDGKFFLLFSPYKLYLELIWIDMTIGLLPEIQ